MIATPGLKEKMLKTSREFFIWLAGFWQADGSVYTYTYKKTYATSNQNYKYIGLKVALTQKDKKFLDKIHKILLSKGISGSVTKYIGKNGCFDIRYCSRQAEKLLQCIYPFVQSELKRKRVRDCIKKVNTYPGITTNYSWRKQ